MTDFWTQVVRRADSCLGAVIGVLEYSSDAKISNFHLPVLGHKDVLSFEVAKALQAGALERWSKLADCTWWSSPYLLKQILSRGRIN